MAADLGESRADAVGVLLAAADEPTEVRKWAFLALAELHEPAGPAGVPAGRPATATRSSGSSRAHGFDRLRARDSLGEVVRLLDDRESGCREAAASALASIGDGRLRPLLVGAVATDPYPWVRDAAKHALGQLGRS